MKKGEHPSEETRRRMSIAQSGENNHFYRKTHSEETKKKLWKFKEFEIVSGDPKAGMSDISLVIKQ
jgi:hypothetical protein